MFISKGSFSCYVYYVWYLPTLTIDSFVKCYKWHYLDLPPKNICKSIQIIACISATWLDKKTKQLCPLHAMGYDMPIECTPLELQRICNLVPLFKAPYSCTASTVKKCQFESYAFLGSGVLMVLLSKHNLI